MRPRANNMIMQLHIQRRFVDFYRKFGLFLKFGSISMNCSSLSFKCLLKYVFSSIDFRCFIILHATIGHTMVIRRWDLLVYNLNQWWILDRIDYKLLIFASESQFVVLTYFLTCQDPRAVLVGLLIILSGFQYLNQSTRYNQVLWYIEYHTIYC